MRRISFFYILAVLIILFFISEFLIVLLGYGKAAFFLIFPIFYSSNLISLIPLIFILIIFVLPFFYFHRDLEENEYYNIHEAQDNIKTEKESSYGGFILVGPIPIMFGKNMDKRLIYLMLIIFLIMIVIYFLIFLNL